MGDDNPLNDYDPFVEREAPPSLSPFPASPSGADADQELRDLEERLNVWEHQLNAQEQQLLQAQRTGVLEPPPNWPPYHPLVHFAPAEVPEPLRPFAERAMLAWLLMAGAFALNFLGCLALLRAGDAADSPGSKIALSALYLFLVVPIALDLTALAVYRALRDSAPSSLAFVKIFVFLGASTAFQAVLTLGFETSGSCGLVTALSLFLEGHAVIGLLALATTVALAASTLLHSVLLSGLWRYWRNTDQGGRVDFRQEATNALTNIVMARIQAPGAAAAAFAPR
jgi:hypothetical protein